MEQSDEYKLLKEIVEYGKYSFEQEQRREESLINQAGQMLTAFAFSTAALYMLLPLLLDIKLELGYRFVYFWIGIITFFLLISLLLAMCGMWRWKYRAMVGIGVFFNHVSSNVESFTNKDYLFLVEWKKALCDMNDDIEKLNRRRAILVTSSMWSFVVAVLLVCLAVVNAVIIFNKRGIL